MDIAGVPDTIPRKRFIELVETLGLDVKDLIRLNFKWDGITAEVYALNENGKRFCVDGENIAKRRVYIPVTDVDGEPT